ncbi:MAG: glycosyltransferase [Alphaproteobacteria bacterium]
MAPLVSIGIPTYNGAKYLRESVESVLAQTFKDFDLVIIDDVSTDETWGIAQEYACEDCRVSAVRNSTRLGLVANFNRCVELTKGRYVCVWHQDDLMMPHNIEQKVALLEANPQVGFVHSNVLMIDGQGRLLSEHWESDSRRDYVCTGREFFLKMIEPDKNYVCCPSVVARRECYERLGKFREELFFACDWELWMRFSLDYDVGCLGTPLIQFRRHGASVSHSVEGSIAETEQELLAKRLIFTEHGNRLPNVRELKKRVMKKLSRDERLRARRAFNENKLRESWSRLWFSAKIDPASLWQPGFAGLAVRLLLGPRTCRRIKSALVKKKLKL